MKTFEVFKAQGIGREEEVRSASLVDARMQALHLLEILRGQR